MLLSLTIGNLACVHTHTYSSFRSNGAAAVAAARVYRHSRLDKNSAGFRDSELEALYERETGATASRFANTQSNKLRGIGNRRSARSRAKPHTRAPWLRGGFYFSCPRVRCARYTSSRLAHDFVTIAPFYSRRRPALTTQPRPRSESQYNPRYINL